MKFVFSSTMRPRRASHVGSVTISPSQALRHLRNDFGAKGSSIRRERAWSRAASNCASEVSAGDGEVDLGLSDSLLAGLDGQFSLDSFFGSSHGIGNLLRLGFQAWVADDAFLDAAPADEVVFVDGVDEGGHSHAVGTERAVDAAQDGVGPEVSLVVECADVCVAEVGVPELVGAVVLHGAHAGFLWTPA